MKAKPLEPVAHVLLESMRAIGYTLESAIADIVDNSVSARAKVININFPPGSPTELAIMDDGEGMTADELEQAMRHGSQDPRNSRGDHDLGRFGLGLKTASLSQCRNLTVATKKNGIISAAVWDLDFVRDQGAWLIQVLDNAEIEALPYADVLKAQTSGTLVLWQKLDELEKYDLDDGASFSEQMVHAQEHLSLVFHRFLEGDVEGGKIRISVNNRALTPLDPFLRDVRATQKHPEEEIFLENHVIRVKAFTLPHISKLSQREVALAGGSEGLRRQQGFYVYRNKRLLTWGTWFRMFRHEELTKLTRVMVDIPNSLDHLWTLDIKKSAATPPFEVKRRLKELVPKLLEESTRVQQFRGKKTFSGTSKPLWSRLEDRGEVRYEIDRNHPLISSSLSEIKQKSGINLEPLLRAIEGCFPGEAFYNDRANERIGFKVGERTKAYGDNTTDQLHELAWNLYESLSGDPEGRRQLFSTLDAIQPFSDHPEVTRDIKEKFRDGN